MMRRDATEPTRAFAHVVSPSDIVGPRLDPAGLVPGARLRVGGRVATQRDREVVLVDALGELSVSLEGAQELAPGTLVVVEGKLEHVRIVDAVIISERPLPEPAHGGEYARLAWDGVGPRLLARSRALAVVRAFFGNAGFVEVQTPARLRAPALEANVDALPVGGDWLATSPELHMKRLLAGGLPRIYQVARTWRADEIGAWHEPEFTLLEWYRAFADYDAVLEDTEQIVSSVVRSIRAETILRGPDGQLVDVTPPFERLTIREAFRRFADTHDAAELAASDPDRYFDLLVDRVEPALRRRSRPLFLVEYPITEAALARATPHDSTVAERFELYVAGIEICNGFGELVDPVEQRCRFEAERERREKSKLPVYPVDEQFLAALEEGIPPSAGNALGFDRLVALATNAPGVAAVQPFPENWR
ncbi:MAG: EF-P lysine aminoacylase GenX [Polyangiaceae bacterium]|nr:EF-P lysine aminoacylase GenX [Polyangiaceae bacterium]